MPVERVLGLDHTTCLPGFDFIHPPADRDTLRDKLGILDILHIGLHSLLQLRERQEIQATGFQLSRSVRTVQVLSA